MGAPPKYDQAYARLALQLYREMNATDDQVARVIGVARKTIDTWANEYPDFAEARAHGKADADAQVEAALFKRAIGFSARKEKVVATKDGAWVEEYNEYYPPETTACIFWLSNRKKNEWKQRQTTEHQISKPLTLAYPLREKPPAPELGPTPATEVIDVTPVDEKKVA